MKINKGQKIFINIKSCQKIYLQGLNAWLWVFAHRETGNLEQLRKN